jgi:polysaccharide pyruvyl transferase WcaK-like protein
MPNTSHRKVLLVGYGGANNTGADVRIIMAIRDVKECLGADTEVTVLTLDKSKTARVVKEDSTIHIAQVPSLFFFNVLRLAFQHDITMLVEGSTFMDHWSKALFYYFMWAALMAVIARRKTIAYAVDVGEMSRLNQRIAAAIANRMTLVITRTALAKTRLQHLGVKVPIYATADLALDFMPESPIQKQTPNTSPTIAIAPIEFFHWPVRIKLWASRDTCYRWPYFFTWTKERRVASATIIKLYSRFIEKCITKYNARILLIAMEELDTIVCEKIVSALSSNMVSAIERSYAVESSPNEIVSALRHSDLLITSRYHASVLSLAAGVPQIAIGHDTRLESIYEECGLHRQFFLNYKDGSLERKLWEAFEALLVTGRSVRSQLLELYNEQFLRRRMLNKCYLRALYSNEHERQG